MKEASGWWGLLAFAIALLLALFWASPPSPRSVEAPRHDASAGRALGVLDRLLADVGSHPVGTAAARIVEARILRELQAIGLHPSVRSEVLCEGAHCVRIRNIEAVLPGRDPTLAAILVSSHYDSVRSGPGYGDDGSGVAASLEIARALSHDSPLDRDVVFLFNEGEEDALWGSKAFVTHSPERERIDLVVNLEARGTGGPSYLFEMSGPTRALASTWDAAARAPSGSSLYVAVYDMLPNNTDLTIYRNAGYQGYNFAFLGGGEYYHTPLDDRAHLDAGSVQHHIDQALGLVRRAGRAERDEAVGDDVFFDVLGMFVARWPVGWNGLALAGAALWGVVAGGVLIRRRKVPLWRLALAPVLLATALILPGALSIVLDTAISVGGGEWRTLPWLYRSAVWISVIAVWMGLGSLGRRLGADAVYVGVMLVEILLAGLLWWFLPGGFYLGLIPAACAALAVSTRAGLPRSPGTGIIELVAATVACVFWLRLAIGFEVALGLSAPVIAIPLSLALLPLMPRIGGEAPLRTGPGWRVALGTAAAAVCMLLPLFAAPGMSESHPYGLVGRHAEGGWRLANRTFPDGGPVPVDAPSSPSAPSAEPRLVYSQGTLLIHPRPGVDALTLSTDGARILEIEGHPVARQTVHWTGEAPNGLVLALSVGDAPVRISVTEAWQAGVELPPGFVEIHDGLRAEATTVHTLEP